MVTVIEARNAVISTVQKGKKEILSLSKTTGCILAEDIISPIDSPPFDNSAMDGYAFRFDDFVNRRELKIIGESAAGKSFSKQIKQGEAVRIFTGAEIPFGADTVVMQENISIANEKLIIQVDKIFLGANIRYKGSQIKKKELALKKGAQLNPGTIGFLSSIGIGKVKVFSKPKVVIIVTGNELQQPVTKLKTGNIYESNSVALQTALQSVGINFIKKFIVKDNKKSIRATFKKAMKQFDFILFTGGISVGDYDFVGKIMEEEKVKTIFYKVKQKPGKPLFFGTKNKNYIFGLPGNPASVLTCFYEYVFPALRKFHGYENPFLKSISVSLTKTINKKSGLTHFLKAATDYKTVTPMEGQESFIMKSFSDSNCFIVVPEEAERINEGDSVEIHLLQ
ncbi:MAG: molybdopterin molybdenumtransferase MoeA [Sphingobacteriales bacterium]|nr:MAG: molybdopterin molybdenumtransferase MoeA [Sphingobacteriales bacterium]